MDSLRREALGLLYLAMGRLGHSYAEFGKVVGVSPRTIIRWKAKESTPTGDVAERAARAVYPLDAALAARLAAECGHTLESLGLVPPVPAGPPPAPPRPYPPAHIVVDAIVCAAADAMQAPPASVRDALRSAFSRARELGLSLDEVHDALAPAKAAKP